MGKLAEIKDMEEAVENGSQEAKEFIAFTKRQAEHNALVEKLLKIVAGCAIGVVAVAAVSALILVPRVSALVSDANAITAQAKEMMPQAAQAVSGEPPLYGPGRQQQPGFLFGGGLAPAGESGIFKQSGPV